MERWEFIGQEYKTRRPVFRAYGVSVAEDAAKDGFVFAEYTLINGRNVWGWKE